MMKTTRYIFAAFIGILLYALPSAAQNGILTASAFKADTYLSVKDNVNFLDFTSAASSASFAISSNTTVVPRSKASWLRGEIKGDSVRVYVDANTGARRSSVLTLAAPDGNSRTVTVTQLGSDPDFIFRTDTVKVEGVNSAVVVSITSNTPLTFTPSDSWITSRDVAFSSGTKDYVLMAGTMDKGERFATVTVSATADATKKKDFVVDQTFEGYPRFLVMSDVHIGASGQKEKVTNSLGNLVSLSEDPDAIFVVGDLTNNGNLAQYNDFKEIFNSTDILPDYVKRFFVMGNHEWYTNDGGSAMDNYNSLGQDHDKYIDIKGYPFIYIGMNGGGDNSYSQESLTFLRKSLKDAALHYPGKPIFVFQHVPPYGTVQGSGDSDGKWGSQSVYDILKDYPQVVDFSGHTHFSSRCPLTLWQGKFTALNDGGNLDTYVKQGDDVDGLQPEGSSSISEGMAVTVDDEKSFTVNRYDLLRGEEIGAPLVFNAPYDGSHYDYASYKGSKPSFDATGIVTSQLQPTQRSVTFPQAHIDTDTDPNDIVLYYKVDIVDAEGKTIATANRSSRYYLGPDIPDSLSVIVKDINGSGMMHARITAIDPYGNESDPIESDDFEQGNYTPAEGTTVPVADLLNLYVNDDGTGTDKSAMNNVIFTSENKPVAYYDSDYKLPGAKFSGRINQFYSIDYSNNDKIKSALTSGFTMETFFVASDVSAEQTPMSSQEKGGCGFWIYSGGDFYFYVADEAGTYYDVQSTASLKPGKYYHAVATYSTSDRTLRLYINGYPAGEKKIDADLSLVPDEANRRLIIGGDAGPDASACQFPFNGNVMIARLYSKAISRDEEYVLYKDVIKDFSEEKPDTTIAAEAPVADLFDVTFDENGAATDISAQAIAIETGSTVPATYYNETWKRWFAQFPGDDGNCYYGVPYASNENILNAMQGDFSLETLCVINNDGDLDNSLPAVLSSQQSGGVGIEPGSVMEAWGYFSGSYATAYGYDYKVVKDSVYHVVVTVKTLDVETPVMSLYVNGNFAGKASLAGAMSLPLGNAQYFCIGGDATINGGGAEYLLKGEVGLARMYSSALTGPQVKRLYIDLKK